jgi:hypothetical protein
VAGRRQTAVASLVDITDQQAKQRELRAAPSWTA